MVNAATKTFGSARMAERLVQDRIQAVRLGGNGGATHRQAPLR